MAKKKPSLRKVLSQFDGQEMCLVDWMNKLKEAFPEFFAVFYELWPDLEGNALFQNVLLERGWIVYNYLGLGEDAYRVDTTRGIAELAADFVRELCSGNDERLSLKLLWELSVERRLLNLLDARCRGAVLIDMSSGRRLPARLYWDIPDENAEFFKFSETLTKNAAKSDGAVHDVTFEENFAKACRDEFKRQFNRDIRVFVEK